MNEWHQIINCDTNSTEIDNRNCGQRRSSMQVSTMDQQNLLTGGDNQSAVTLIDADERWANWSSRSNSTGSSGSNGNNHQHESMQAWCSLLRADQADRSPRSILKASTRRASFCVDASTCGSDIDSSRRGSHFSLEVRSTMSTPSGERSKRQTLHPKRVSFTDETTVLQFRVNREDDAPPEVRIPSAKILHDDDRLPTEWTKKFGASKSARPSRSCAIV